MAMFFRRGSRPGAGEDGTGTASTTGTASSSTCRPYPAASAPLTSSRRVSLMRSRTKTHELRPVCKFGVNCYRRNTEHLDAEAHPADHDYLECCRESGTVPEFISVRRVFDWADEGRTGKVSRGELEQVWPVIQRIGAGVAPWDVRTWETLDDDGNGYINFMEFADILTRYGVDLPLGVEDLFGESENAEAKLCCGVIDCSCKEFRPMRRRCKYGGSCYQKNPDHLAKFCHPCDADWEESKEVSDPNMCVCGHKRKLHASGMGGGATRPPSYWGSRPSLDDEFHDLVTIEDPGTIGRLQDLFDHTYSDVTTRDRANHNGGDWRVPRGFTVLGAQRNENSKLWRKYTIRKAEQQRERQLVDECSTEDMADLPPYREYRDVITTSIWEHMGGADVLDARVNEWYLWHGTSAKAADLICKNDFKMRLAGTATGTLYGRGTYFAESITKADEYSPAEDGSNTVLLCRVLGGRVRYCDERTPDAEKLTGECTEGAYDCILGDRKVTSNTYREFIIFGTENVYPEYVITYRRGELFKSPSHP